MVRLVDVPFLQSIDPAVIVNAILGPGKRYLLFPLLLKWNRQSYTSSSQWLRTDTSFEWNNQQNQQCGQQALISWHFSYTPNVASFFRILIRVRICFNIVLNFIEINCSWFSDILVFTFILAWNGRTDERTPWRDKALFTAMHSIKDIILKHVSYVIIKG